LSHHLIHGDALRVSPTTHRLEGADYDAGVSFFLVDYPPGQGNELHRHPYAETFVLRSGRAAFTVDDETVTANGGEVVVVPAGTAHRFECVGDDHLVMTCIHASATMQSEWL